ncbi:MAG: hypothetical protein F4Y71_08760 [Acidobacteria bacterium]|nr:hypothetical protein [Acidobacteriota bacterium]MYG74057.1 hypothetical protein [Acidobacteriota bacterium]
MRIATWNIKSLNTRRDELLRWLRENQPDIMGLQETKTDDAEFVERYQPEFRNEGYLSACCGEKGRNGVAILSRRPLEVTQRGLPGQEDLGARLLTALTPAVSFTTVYVPSASRKDSAAEADATQRKLGWIDALLRYIGTSPDGVVPSIVCGDFNIAPEPIDDWMHWHDRKRGKREPGFSDDERSRIRSLEKAGWVDLVRHPNPKEKLFSWWSRPNLYLQNKGLRLDLVFGNQAAVERLRSAQIIHTPYEERGRAGEVDHAPVIVNLA